jgi:hypothetical protein
VSAAAPGDLGRGRGSGERGGGLVAIGAFVLGVAAIATSRGAAAAIENRVKETSDVYVLPPAEDVVRLSLGYRAALADLLWSHVLVSQGLHTMERRRFDNLTRLLDAVIALDPQFREPYLLADALITFQTNETPHHEVVKAREIMEQGTRNRPLDGEIWLVLGQFVGFIAPSSFLTDPAEQEQWRIEGARYLARASELGGGEAWISWQALGGAKLLGKGGQREAEISFYRRTLAVTDDEELKENLRRKLEALLTEEQVEEARRRVQAFQAAKDIPFVNTTMMHLLGPPPKPAWCAGGAHDDDPACATSWREWAERLERTQSARR